MKTVLLVFFLFASTTLCYSQDQIILNSGFVKNVWIIEKTDKEVRYKIMNTPDSPEVILKIYKIDKIIYRNGNEINFPPTPVRWQKRTGTNLGIMYGLGIESGFYKFEIDYFITPGICLEGSGMIEFENDMVGFTIGPKYYFNPLIYSKTKAYIGLSGGIISHEFLAQIPIGISFVSETGFDIEFGVRGIYMPSYANSTIYADLGIGWRF